MRPEPPARAWRPRWPDARSPTCAPGIINAVLPIYDVLGQNEQAYTMVQGELAKTDTPYYYKADLGDLAESLGKKSEAIKWFSEGYAEARGPATRFQWGAMYASSLLRLEPNNAGQIQSVTGQVLGELDGPDRIYRRARMRLARLDKALRKWNADTGKTHQAVIVDLRERMQNICVKIPAASRRAQLRRLSSQRLTGEACALLDLPPPKTRRRACSTMVSAGDS